jgi:hypothetical protein
MLILAIAAAAVVVVFGLLWFPAGWENPALVGRRDQYQKAVIDRGAGEKTPPIISV